MPLNFVGSPSESFFPILITFLTLLDFLAFLLELTEFTIQLVPFVNEFPHLGHEHYIGEV